MNAPFHRPAVTLSGAAAIALIALALRLGDDATAKKTNLTTLYENGAISGAELAWALAEYKLEAA